MLRTVLLFLNAMAIGLLLSAQGTGPLGKGMLAVGIGLNIVLLLWRGPATAAARRIAALVSLAGYLGAGVAALVFVLRCGVAFVDQSCAAVVSPLFGIAFGFAISAVPIVYLGQMLSLRLRYRPLP